MLNSVNEHVLDHATVKLHRYMLELVPYIRYFYHSCNIAKCSVLYWKSAANRFGI